MKKWLCLSLVVVLLSSLTGCSKNHSPGTVDGKADSLQEKAPVAARPENAKRKILIAYFSQARIVSEGADAVSSATPYVGNTASAAYEIQKQVGGDLFEIATVNAYPVSHQEASAIAERELKTNARPALSTHMQGMKSYDVIFLGYPIWWYTEPMAIRTFLEEYDLSGKTIVPFCTTLGAGIEESRRDIQSLSPNAIVLEGLTLRTGRQDMSGDIAKWLTKAGLAK